MSALTVVFDLDGTLVDTAPDLVDTLNVVFARQGLPAVPYAIARNMIGGGARRMIERGLTSEGHTFTAAEIDRLFADFIEYYSAHIADRSRPFPGLEAALDQLAARNCRFAVCTNKLEGLSRLLLDTLGMTQRFAAIVGQDTFGIQKPDPDILRRTIGQAGGEVGAAVLVGDSRADIDTARAAGVPIIAVTFGYTDIPVTELRPDRFIGHFQELPAAVFDVISVRPRPEGGTVGPRPGLGGR